MIIRKHQSVSRVPRAHVDARGGTRTFTAAFFALVLRAPPPFRLLLRFLSLLLLFGLTRTYSFLASFASYFFFSMSLLLLLAPPLPAFTSLLLTSFV